MANRFDRLALLETFVRIAERRSLSAAARDLGTSQPSISRQLAALEERLGTVLVRRTTHDATLTPDGVALLTDARRLLGEWEAIEDRHSDEDSLSGTIRVVAPIALGQGLFVRAAIDFMRKHPGVAVQWRLTDEPIRFAEEGCDCWLKVGPVPDDTLIIRSLGHVERLVVGTKDYAEEYRATKLSDYPWLTLGPFEGERIELFDVRGNKQEISVNARLASENIFVLREALLNGVGVAIMPSWFVAEELKSGTLVDLAPRLRAARLPVNLALASGTKRPSRVSRFVEVLEKWAANELPD